MALTRLQEEKMLPTARRIRRPPTTEEHLPEWYCVAENVETLITDVSSMRSERSVVVMFLITCAAARARSPSSLQWATAPGRPPTRRDDDVFMLVSVLRR